MLNKAIEWMETTPIFPVLLSLWVIFILLKFIVKTFFPGVTRLAAISEAVSELPAMAAQLNDLVTVVSTVPQLKEEMESLKTRMGEVENKLTELVNSNILPMKHDITAN